MGGGSTMIHSRRLRAVTTLAALGWMLTTAGPIAAKTITYTPQQVYYTYCFSHPPAARIASGDTVVTKTRDASNDLIQPTDKTTGKLDLSRLFGAPATTRSWNTILSVLRILKSHEPGK